MSTNWLDIALTCFSIAVAYGLSLRQKEKDDGRGVEVGTTSSDDLNEDAIGGTNVGDRSGQYKDRVLNPRKAFVLPSYIHHARMLPVESGHAFRYPTLYLAVPLGELESGACDVGVQGRLFRWNDTKSTSGKKGSLTALEASDYLAAPRAQDDGSTESTETSWLRKLDRELRTRGWLTAQETLADSNNEVWAVTMPSFMGFHGINPLTVYYIYRQAFSDVAAPRGGPAQRGPLWLCLLEVHNTFGERHMYVLATNVGEDEESEAKGSFEGSATPLAGAPSPRGDGLSWSVARRRGDYEHQWTFPRSFHVSPFNDRGGYYRLYLKDLWRKNSARHTSPTPLPTLDIRLLLMEPTQDTDASVTSTQPMLRKKLLATLSSFEHGSVKRPQVLTWRGLVAALVRQPFDLVLTFGRIAWEAAKLHFGRPHLDVYHKPEMSLAARDDLTVASVAEELTLKRVSNADTDFNGVGWPPSTNRTQLERLLHLDHGSTKGFMGGVPRKNGSLMWNDATFADREGKARFKELVRRSKTQVRIISADGSEEDIMPAREPETSLTVYLLAPSFFSDVLLYGHGPLSLLLGSIVGRRWGVSDINAFNTLFEAADDGRDLQQDKVSLARRAVVCIRSRHIRWAEGLARPWSMKGRQDIDHSFCTNTSVLDTVFTPSWRLALAIFGLHAGLAGQELAFRWLRVRYVAGTEPWLEWKRGAVLLS